MGETVELNFALPDLRGRVPVSFGSGIGLGEKAGEENHTLNISELPTHTHTASGVTANGNTPIAPADILAAEATALYGSAANLVNLASGMISAVGGSQPHSNQQPYLTLNFCIALSGIFPSQS